MNLITFFWYTCLGAGIIALYIAGIVILGLIAELTEPTE